MREALFQLARPLLRSLDAETAHRLTVLALAAAPPRSAPADDPRLSVTAFGLSFRNPVGMAAGFDKHAEVADAVLALGFGAVEVGGVTPRPQPGNPRPRVFRLPEDGAVINRYGLNSEGVDAVAGRLARRRQTDGVIGVNIGANKESADRAADYAALITTLSQHVDYFSINVSSPNTPGLRDLQGRAMLDDLLARCADARDSAVERHGRRPLLVKIAPDLDETALDDIVAVATARGMDGMIVANTTVARPMTLVDQSIARETGGLSGRPLFMPSTRLLAQTFLRVDGAFPLIGVGGVDGANAALTKIEAGATLVQLYTAMVFQGPGLVTQIKRELVDALTAENLTNIGPLIGRRARDLAAGAPF